MSETEAPLLQLNGVSVVYDGHAVIDDLSLEVGRGEFVVIHGSTGCGKSTILRLFAGLIDPTKGEVVVAGDRIDEFDEAQRRWLRRSMGLMMQEELLLEDRTVLENVMLPALAADETAQEARRRALLALNKCGAADLADLRPSSLSAGQRQIACLARAVVNRPVLILADEPATHLDKTNAQTLINLLSAFALAGVTVVAATHQHLTPEGCRSREITLSASNRGGAASSRAWALKETFRGFRQNFSLFSLATFLSALALSIPLFISTIFYELAEPIRQIPTSVEITVFTKSGTDMEKLSKAVAEIETIERVSLVPKDEAIRSLNEHLGLKDKAVKHNPLPDILIATVSSSTSPAGVDAAAGRIEKIEGVDMLAYETDWREKLDALSNAARLGLLCLGIVVLTLVMLVVAASIRLTTLSVQPQMKALYLFGASPSFAMRPIAWRGFILMMSASLGAIAITYAGLAVLGHPIATVARLYEVELALALPPVDWCAGFVIICSLIGYIIALLSAQDAWRKARR